MQNKASLMEAARGHQPLDLLIEDIQLVNVYTGEIYPADIGIADGRVVYAGPRGWASMEPKERWPGHGQFAVPGLIDVHVHIESSMMRLSGFAAAVLPCGTTTVVIDPHEIANVLGQRGVRYMLEATASLPLHVYLQVPSCVPSVPGLETAGAEFGAPEIAAMLSWDRVIGIAEVMDYAGVIGQKPRMQGIMDVALARNVVVSGHCPGLTGRELAAYLIGGPDSDHEATAEEELLDKLRQGMTVEGRVSSFSQSVLPLAKIVRELGMLPPNLAMCTDDVLPEDLQKNGHMDQVVRSAVAAGFSPVEAIRAATLNGAHRHRLYDLGAIAPAKRADILLVRDLENFRPSAVFVDGALVARDGRLTVTMPARRWPLEQENTVHLPSEPKAADFLLTARPGHTVEHMHAIVIEPGRFTTLETVELPVQKGFVDFTAVEDITLIAVLERHGRSGRRGLALARGLRLREGAIASTVAHDSHNLLIVGRNAQDMALAARELAACGGGICCVDNGEVKALLPLPIAGLMSPLSLDKLVPLVQRVNQAMRRQGMDFAQPLSLVLGLALPVIPHYSVTDMGLVDVDHQTVISPWADGG